MNIESITNKIINADCMDILKQLPDKCIDLVITSPPYNLGKFHHTGNFKHIPYEDDLPENIYQEWQINVLNELFRILKDNGNVFYNHKNRIKDGFLISPYCWILRSNFKIKQEITWKNGGQNLDKIRFFPMSEKIFWLSKNNTKINNTLNLTDVWNYTDVCAEKNNNHKRAFSEKFVFNLISVASNENDLILDCFSGSGTTCKVAYDLKRNYIGIEKDYDYWKASVERLKNAQAQLRLF